MKWFQGVNTIEELRKHYQTLLKKYHPDNEGGSLEITQEINKDYDSLFSALITMQFEIYKTIITTVMTVIKNEYVKEEN